MVAQTAEWVGEQEKFTQRRSFAEGASGREDANQEIMRAKLGPARGIVLGVMAGALCWGVIISAIIQLR